jgi:hypothetical protein
MVLITSRSGVSEYDRKQKEVEKLEMTTGFYNLNYSIKIPTGKTSFFYKKLRFYKDFLHVSANKAIITRNLPLYTFVTVLPDDGLICENRIACTIKYVVFDWTVFRIIVTKISYNAQNFGHYNRQRNN